jgi:hypothetical protein
MLEDERCDAKQHLTSRIHISRDCYLANDVGKSKR